MSGPTEYAVRERLCDLGFLREPFAKVDGSVGYRCAGEPVHMFVRKGGYRELPIVIRGSDLTERHLNR